MDLAPDDGSPPVITYRQQIRPFAPSSALALRADHLEIAASAKTHVFPYADIAALRLIYQPRNLANDAYRATIIRKDGRSVALTNLSWRGLVDLDRQDAAYVRFLGELARRAAAANPAADLLAGLPPWRFALTALAGLAVVLALGVVIVSAFAEGGRAVAAAAGLLALYFVWWTARYLTRNRPRRFSPDAPPEGVLPRVAPADHARDERI